MTAPPALAPRGGGPGGNARRPGGQRARRPEADHWFLHAGEFYRRPIERRLLGSVAAPLEGLGIGEPLAWYTQPEGA